MVCPQRLGRKNNVVSSDCKFLEPDLMDIVRLFEGAESLDIAHSCDVTGAAYENSYRFGVWEMRYIDFDIPRTDVEHRSLIKRYAKLGLYRVLSEYFHKTLPWGSLTGIRPTRLAYSYLEKAAWLDDVQQGPDGTRTSPSFAEFFKTLGVSEENIALTARVLRGQEGIYEKKEGNCDLFVSLPFCPTKCSYCSFITAPIAATRQYMPAYLQALERELADMPPIKTLRSVYIGGGTPFVLEPEELRRVLKAIAKIRPDGCEFTVEAGRPDVFTEQKLALCKEYGVTRICINAQSFSDRTLEAIGRKHTAADVFRAFEMAAPYGFDVNCDLIAGLTGESLDEFRASVDTAVSLDPANITVHTLCLKKGARLKEEHLSDQTGPREKPALTKLDEGSMSEMIAYSREKLTQAGYEPYYLYRQKYMAGAHENVGWTKPHKACIYNVDTMEECADNLAVGANAISKKLFFSEDGVRIERIGSPKDIPTYLAKTDTLIDEKKKLFAAP